MPATNMPPAVDRAFGSLHAFAALLSCVDATKWQSLGRPEAAGLAAIAFTLTAELEGALADAFEAPP